MTRHRHVLVPVSVSLLMSVAALRGRAVPQGAGGGGGGGANLFVTSPGLADAAAPMPAGTGAISGVVTDGATGRPLPRAVVSLALGSSTIGPVQGSRAIGRQMTDTKGRFVFTDLPTSDGYTIVARRTGYFEGAYGADAGSAQGARLLLSDGDWYSKADISIWPTAVISGTVVDEHGDPIVGAYVRALKRVFVAGNVHLAAGRPVRTDDRGVYRIAGLDPGTYLVEMPVVAESVPADTSLGRDLALDPDGSSRRIVGRYPIPPSIGGAPSAYGITFYPAGSRVAEAAPIEIRYGADSSGIDLRVRAVPTWHVAGRVEGPADARSGLTLRLLAAGNEELGQGSETATALVGKAGEFAFAGVPSGDYVLDARSTTAELSFSSPSAAARFSSMPASPGVTSTSMSGLNLPGGAPNVSLTTLTTTSSRVWGRVAVSVDGRDAAGIVLDLRPTVSIVGHVAFDGATPPVSVPFVIAEAANGDPSSTRTRTFGPDTARATDRFLIDGMLPGAYVLSFRYGDRYAVKTIAADGRPASNAPFDVSGDRDVNVTVTITSNVAAITGTVRGTDGAPAKTGGVIIFPDDPAQWSNYGITSDRIRTAHVSSAGIYKVSGLPAGDYLVAGVDDSDMTAWQDPAFLRRIAPLAAHVSCAWGDEKTVNVSKAGGQ